MKPNLFLRAGKVNINTVIPLILDPTIERAEFFGCSVSVKGGSLRLKTFAVHGVVCSCCGLAASFFAVEAHKTTNAARYHLNLWGIDRNNKQVLFTHDHTISRGNGGRDALDNTTTMCAPCNNKKGIRERKNVHVNNALVVTDRANDETSNARQRRRQRRDAMENNVGYVMVMAYHRYNKANGTS